MSDIWIIKADSSVGILAKSKREAIRRFIKDHIVIRKQILNRKH